MGASGWVYHESYDADVEVVLQRLRDRVFKAGDYYREDDDLDIAGPRDPAVAANNAVAARRLRAVVEEHMREVADSHRLNGVERDEYLAATMAASTPSSQG